MFLLQQNFESTVLTPIKLFLQGYVYALILFNMQQGWGNKKGMVSIVDESAPGGFKDGGEPLPAKAPGDYQPRPPCVVAAVNVPHEDAAVCLKCQIAGSTGPHVLWCRVGGGGGHALAVSNCRVHALVCRQPS